MAYGLLDSPLPGLTVSPTGERCCGFRGLGYQPGAHALLGDALHVRLGELGMLGDEPIFDTTSTDPGSLIDPGVTDQPAPIIDLTPPETLPLPNQLSPSISSLYPQSVGTEFTSNGDGNYTNIQTGQTVPYQIAEQITAATAGTPAVDTAATGQNLTITDPNTGATSSVNTNNLTVAAQALQAAGQLVNAAGKLTAQGQALLHQGNLYKPAQTSSFGSGISGAVSSLTSWFTESSLISGFPNYGVVGVAVLAVAMVPALMSGRKKRR